MDKQLAQHRTREQGSRIAAAAHLNYEFAMYRGLSGIEMTSPDTVAKSNVNWLACAVVLGAVPLMLLALIAFQAFISRSASTWKRPSWYINPFLIDEPLQFFHLVAFAFIAGGVVGIATLPFRSVSVAPLAMWLLSIGVGAWLGVQLSMKVCHKKMEAG